MRHAFALLVFAPALVLAQPPPGYYDTAGGLSGEPLRTALRDIISPHQVLLYTQLWNAFPRTDRKANNTVWDIYSDVPGGTPPYVFQFGNDQCGEYNNEGDCFNREHTMPVSWFNDVPPMNTDLHHIYPTDGWVNSQRGNWPYGTVSTPSYTSANGGKRGPCTWPGCSGTVFEPINAYKGDLARGHFYMLTRYMNESPGWTAPILAGGEFLSWTESLLLAWHAADPVSAKEIARNDSIYRIQGNRNPYIDNPQWAYSIWGPLAGIEDITSNTVRVWYSDGTINVTSTDGTRLPVQVVDATGRTVLADFVQGNTSTVAFNAAPGVYLVLVGNTPQRTMVRFVR